MTDTTALVLKIVFIFVFFFLALGSGVLPAKSKRCQGNQNVLGIANSFAGGVFLAIAFTHILPEEVEDYEVLTAGQDNPYPLPFLLYFVGYTFILIVDRVVFDSHALFEDDHHGEHGHEVKDPAEQKLIDITRKSILQTEQAFRSHANDPKFIKKSLALQKESIREGMRSYLSKTDKFSVRMSHAMGSTLKPLERIDEQQELFVDKANVEFNEADATGNRQSNKLNGSYSCNDCESVMQGNTMTASQVKKYHDENKHEVKLKKHKGGRCGCNMTPFILMLALSIHSLFEGIALGLQKDVPAVVNILIAISLHKWAASMSLGISLNKTFAGDFKKLFMLVTTFACATPLGIILGIALGEAPPIVDVIFSCLAGGTFIYIACSEVIVEEFSIPGNKWIKLLAFILGAALISSLWFIPGS